MLKYASYVIFFIIDRNRASLSDSLTITKGLIVRHKSFYQQVMKYLSTRVNWCPTDVEAACLRFRTQQAHIRDYKRDVQLGVKKLPKDYENTVGALMNLIALTPDGPEDDGDDDEGTPDAKRRKEPIDIIAAAARLTPPSSRSVSSRELIALSSEEYDPADYVMMHHVAETITPEEIDALFEKTSIRTAHR